MFVLSQIEGIRQETIRGKINETYSSVRTNADSMKWPVVVWCQRKVHPYYLVILPLDEAKMFSPGLRLWSSIVIPVPAAVDCEPEKYGISANALTYKSKHRQHWQYYDSLILIPDNPKAINLPQSQT